MHTKASPPISHIRHAHASPFVRVYFEFNHLKQLYRQGWLQRGVPPTQCESVAEHSFGVALLALFLAEAYFPDLDVGKVMRMALLHDCGEIDAGDLTPAHGLSDQEKYRREQQSVVRVLSTLPGGADYIALWEEYEREASPEAQFVRQVDRLEMVLQASVYEHHQLADLSEFFAAGKQALSAPQLRAMVADLEALRA
jgi:putative hydrolase of HD superfamily